MLLLPWFNSNPKMINYLYYTGDTVTAQEALAYGMIAKVMPRLTVVEQVRQLQEPRQHLDVLKSELPQSS